MQYIPHIIINLPFLPGILLSLYCVAPKKNRRRRQITICLKIFSNKLLKKYLFPIKTQCAMQLKNITDDAIYDSTKHKVYPPYFEGAGAKNNDEKANCLTSRSPRDLAKWIILDVWTPCCCVQSCHQMPKFDH